jgi:hypothetical protein
MISAYLIRSQRDLFRMLGLLLMKNIIYRSRINVFNDIGVFHVIGVRICAQIMSHIRGIITERRLTKK